MRLEAYKCDALPLSYTGKLNKNMSHIKHIPDVTAHATQSQNYRSNWAVDEDKSRRSISSSTLEHNRYEHVSWYTGLSTPQVTLIHLDKRSTFAL